MYGELYPGGNTLFDGLYGEAPPERGIFIRYESVGISLVEVYRRVGKSVIWVYEREQKGPTDEFYWFIELRKRSVFVIDSNLKDSTFTAVERDAMF